MDKIFIKQLQLPVIIGVFEEERQSKQTLLLDIDLFTDIHSAHKTDRVNDTLNYATVRQALLNWSSVTQFQLIESLAEYLAQKVIAEFTVKRVLLTLQKKPFDITDAKSVGISIERSRK